MMSNFDMQDLSHLPPDDEILEEIRKILSTADLMKVSKKTVKQELERRFEVNLDAKRPYINSGKSASCNTASKWTQLTNTSSHRSRSLGSSLITHILKHFCAIFFCP
jgi:hypothetical protein